jgi:hypothetical protein
MTTPIAPALKNFQKRNDHLGPEVFPEAPADILNHFWVKVAVSLLKLKPPLRNRFGIETVTNL